MGEQDLQVEVEMLFWLKLNCVHYKIKKKKVGAQRLTATFSSMLTVKIAFVGGE